MNGLKILENIKYIFLKLFIRFTLFYHFSMKLIFLIKIINLINKKPILNIRNDYFQIFVNKIMQNKN